MIHGLSSEIHLALQDSSVQQVPDKSRHHYCRKKSERILKRMGVKEQVPEIDFELKETVRVTEGPFANFTGTIENIDTDKLKVKVHVNMFGRETPVELDFNQIEKI